MSTLRILVVWGVQMCSEFGMKIRGGPIISDSRQVAYEQLGPTSLSRSRRYVSSYCPDMLKPHIHTIKTRKIGNLRINSVKIVYSTKLYANTNIFKDLYDLVGDYLLNLKRSMLSGSSSCAENIRWSVDLQGVHEDPESRRVFSASFGGFKKQYRFSPDGSLRIFI